MSLNVSSFQRVDYNVLDRAKNAFIEASRKTLFFAEKYGFVPDARLGASANVFALKLDPFIKAGSGEIYLTLVPEGLGTADDARPADLTKDELLSFWRNIGIKTVATMTNDVASAGMQPILLGLYLPSSTPATVFNDEFMSGFLDGVVEGCRSVGCVYLSGETPELKTKITPGVLDIAGAVCGIVPPKQKVVSSQALSAGDQIVFIESSGPHENGFTTLRSMAEKLPNQYRTKLPSGMEFWQAINAPSKLYAPLIQKLLSKDIELTNIEPITGHGWLKLMRSSQNLRYVIKEVLPIPEVFSYIEQYLKLSRYELITTFNCGVGLALFTPDKKSAAKIVKIASESGLNACLAGQVEEYHERQVYIEPYDITLGGDSFVLKK